MNKDQNEVLQEIEEERKERTLDQVFEELDQVIRDMEGEASLEESFRMYHQGMDLLKVCNDKIDRIEKQILVLDEEGETHEF